MTVVLGCRKSDTPVKYELGKGIYIKGAGKQSLGDPVSDLVLGFSNFSNLVAQSIYGFFTPLFLVFPLQLTLTNSTNGSSNKNSMDHCLYGTIVVASFDLLATYLTY